MKKFLGLLGVLLSAVLLMPNVFAAGEEAKIGEVLYQTLEEAYTAAEAGDTIVLLSDVELTDTLVVTKDLTLDLNGKTISKTSNVINVDGAKLVVTGKGTIKETAPDNAGIKLYGSSKLEDINYTSLEVGKDVTIEAWSPIFISIKSGQAYAYGVNVDVLGGGEGKLIAKNDQAAGTGIAVYVNGSIKDKDNYPVINIGDGVVMESSGIGVYQAGYSEITIGKANITAVGAGIASKAGILNLNGTTVKATGDSAEPDSFNNGVNHVGAAIQIESSNSYAGDIEVNINGGTYESVNNAAIVEYLADASGNTPAATETEVKEIKITDGNFVAKEGTAVIAASDNFKETKTEFISGGTFSSDVKDYLAEDIELVEDEDGNLVAGIIYNVTTKKVANGKLAFDKLSGLAGTVIKVTATADKDYELKELKVVDADGKEVKVTDGSFTMPESDVVVSATFAKVVVPEENPETSDMNVITVLSVLTLGVAGLGYTLKKRRFN